MTPAPLDFKRVLWRAHADGIHHGSINFWAGMLACLLDPVSSETRILEFGSTGSEFLRFFHLAYEYREAAGILLSSDGPDHSAGWCLPEGPTCFFVPEEAAASLASGWHLAFTQETFSLLPDLEAHARLIDGLLAADGVYYATFGWHLDNPETERYAASRKAAGKPFFAHTLSGVVAAFEQSGFEVGFKRLPVPYFFMHSPPVATRFGGVPTMIEALSDWKILFQFRKWSRP